MLPMSLYRAPADDNRASAAERSRASRLRASAAGARPRPNHSDEPYDDDESEFLAAMDEYIRRTGRKFPTWTEALDVLRSLGWRR
jgi:hypothetical protein